MKYLKLTVGVACAVLLASVYTGSAVTAQEPSNSPSGASQSAGTLERGYRTGYSDGYQSGIGDSADHARRDYRNKNEYRNADRAYTGTYGSLEDYRDGYKQGFENGYNAGFDHRGFDSSVPPGLSSRVITDTAANSSSSASNSSSSSPAVGNNSSSSSPSTNPTANSSGNVIIPGNTVLRIELLNSLSTEASQRGDHFQARVLEPHEYEGAIMDGRVTSVKRPGRGHGTAQLQLSIESIRLTDGRFANLSAQVIEVITPEGTGARDVDPEGGVRGQGSTKDDVAKIGAGTGIGAIIGAITGGGRGAAIGAAIGGGVSTGGVLASHGKEIRLPRGQQLKIRTAKDTRF